MKHATPKTARIEDCIRLTYRTPADSVLGLLPEGLELVTRGPWAFWNVMACRIHKRKACGVPGGCNVTYKEVSYRLHVQAMNERAEVLRGLASIRCDVDQPAALKTARRVVGADPSPAKIKAIADDCRVSYAVYDSVNHESELELDLAHAPASLLAGSCFPTVEDARRFSRAGTNILNTIERGGRRFLGVTRVEYDESIWSETPLAARKARIGYFDTIGQGEHVQLEWACRLGTMEYRWINEKRSGFLQQPETSNQPLARAS